VAAALSDVDSVDHLVLAAIERESNTAVDGRMSPGGSILLFGGQARVRPYPGSTTVTTVNGGVVAMVTTLALEFAPVRVNAIHPGIVGDSPYWTGRAEYLESVRLRTPTGQLVRMRDIVDSVVFLLENPAVNGVNLPVDGGWLVM
jgi:NAD(P)-dependent dehydrogenase (short-subunit alcohol dehydrogenase family)